MGTLVAPIAVRRVTAQPNVHKIPRGTLDVPFVGEGAIMRNLAGKRCSTKAIVDSGFQRLGKSPERTLLEPLLEEKIGRRARGGR